MNLQDFIDESMSRNGGEIPTMAALNVYASKLRQLEQENSRGLSFFEGYSMRDMHAVILSPWSHASPLKLNILEEADFESIPILRQIRHLISILQKEGKIKLTTMGNIPTKIVKEIYDIGVADWYIGRGLVKLLKEMDSTSVQLTHILVKIMRIVKEQKGVMTLTKNGEKIATNQQKLLEELMLAFSSKFSLAHFDLYRSMDIGGLGLGFSLILIGKYGSTKRTDRFYADKYIEAFPTLLDDLLPTYSSVEDEASHCYSRRTFEIFMLQLGLISIERKSIMDPFTYVLKTPLFDKMIKISPYMP